MKPGPQRSSQDRKVKLQLPLKKPKETPRARGNRRSVKSDDLVEKNNVESERNQDPGPSNPRRSRRSCPRRHTSRSPVSKRNCSKLDLECFVPVKKLTLAEIEEMKQNLAMRRDKEERNRTQSVEEKPKLCLPQSSKSGQRSRSSTRQKNKEEKSNAHRSVEVAKRQKRLIGENSAELEPTSAIGPGSGIMQLPDKVLQHMFRFVTFADLKSARLVNKHWRQVATTPLRRYSKQIRLDHLVFECVMKMDDGQFPVYQLEVQLFDDPEKAKIGYPYFSGICGWVKELTLKMDMNMNVYDMSQIRVFTGTFPRDCIYVELTHLNLRIYEKTPRTPEFWKEFTDFVQNIQKNSPNLREVNVKYLNYNRYPLPICTVMEDLFPNSNSTGISKLRSVDFHGVPLEKIDFAKWSTLNFKLTKLKIALSSLSNDINALLATFLETQSGTLMELTLTFNGDGCYPIQPVATATFTFPRMEKLEALGFARINASFILVTFPGIDFAKLFPCLKKLDLGSHGLEWRDFIGSNLLEPTNTVEELVLPWNRIPEPVVSAARVFPALRKLEISTHHVLTEAVFENMPNLEVLSLIGSFSFGIDDLVTGLQSEVCRTFEGVLTDTWIQKLKTAEGRSMARLQKLKTLKLTNDNWKLFGFSRLSFHVFNQMSSLKCLDLNGSVDRPIARSYYKDAKKWQLLADLREKFVVL